MGVLSFALFSFLIFLNTSGPVLSDNPCETGWEPYENEKCLKIFPTSKILNLNDAKAFCKQSNSNLISTDFEETQIILSKYFKSNDKNIILCEKPQQWSLSKLQEELVKLQEKIDNVLPVGFIYVQLPREQSPQELWPNYTWADVSSDYDGVFFRTIGRDSAPFGEIQDASSPRIVYVKGYSSKNDTDLHTGIDIEPNGELSQIVRTAYEPNPAYYFYRGLQFQQSADEVRPRNMAVRVWQRTQ